MILFVSMDGETMVRDQRGGQRIEDIVAASGVSRSTVFRYYAGKPVRPAASAAIERAVAVLSSPKTAAPEGEREILASLPPSYGSFRGYAEILEGLFDRARELGLAVRIESRKPGSFRPAGVALIGKRIAEEDAEAELWREAGVPCVLVNRLLEESDRSWVSADCRAAGRDAVAHLIDQGSVRIATWIDELSRVSRDKLRGYRDALERAGLSFDPELVVDPAASSLEEAFASLMGLASPPDGWFSPDDEIALRVISLASARGINVPKDLAIVGMNDSSASPSFSPSLSSVRLPFREMGEAAVDALLRLMDHPAEKSVHILLGHSLTTRLSSLRKGKEE
jgi:Transcriptional regulators